MCRCSLPVHPECQSWVLSSLSPGQLPLSGKWSIVICVCSPPICSHFYLFQISMHYLIKICLPLKVNSMALRNVPVFLRVISILSCNCIVLSPCLMCSNSGKQLHMCSCDCFSSSILGITSQLSQVTILSLIALFKTKTFALCV